MSDILIEIGQVLRWEEMTIQIGFSLIVKNSSDQMIFLYAAKAKSFYKSKLETELEFDDTIKFFEKLSYEDLLFKSFNKTLDSETFQKSGFRQMLNIFCFCYIEEKLELTFQRPHKLIGFNLWITK